MCVHACVYGYVCGYRSIDRYACMCVFMYKYMYAYVCLYMYKTGISSANRTKLYCMHVYLCYTLMVA